MTINMAGKSKDLSVYAIQIPPDALFGDYADFFKRLPEVRKDKILKLKQNEDRLRTLFGETVIRNLIQHKLGIPFDSIDFKINNYGKPFLAEKQDFHFNISHSGQWIVCAVGKYSVGIDIEQVVKLDMDISRNVFSEYEQRIFEALPDARKEAYFFDLWTLKESFMKATGLGFSIAPSSFTLYISKNKVTLLEGHYSADYVFHRYPAVQDYKLAVCVSGKALIPKRIQFLNDLSQTAMS